MLHWKIVRAEDDPALSEGRAPEGLLSPAEEEILADFRFEARRRKWLLGRWAAKLTLTEALRAWEGRVVQPADLTVKNEASGAPYAELEGERLPLCLSISHRENLGVAAVESEVGLAIGIDLELIEGRSPALLTTFFTGAEQAEVAALESEAAKVAVARIWSAKEAVLKALGVGLRRDTRTIEVAPPSEAAGLPDAAPGFAPLTVRLDEALQAEIEGELSVGWRATDAYVLTFASLQDRAHRSGRPAPSAPTRRT